MNIKSCTVFSLFLCLCLSLSLFFLPAAFAEGERQGSFSDDGVITGFEGLGDSATINTDYKLAMIELRKRFPAHLSVRVDSLPRTLEVSWECLEDYDEDLEAFHFAPVLTDYTVADGLKPPVITVNVLGQLETPPMAELWEEDLEPEPVFGSSNQGGGGLPSSYNGYELGLLPPVRNQGSYGTCWAFSTIAAMEADLIHDGNAGTDIDLSELHLAYFTYHDFLDEKGCSNGDHVLLNGADYLMTGGSAYNASLRAANMLDPVQETEVPYAWADSFAPDPAAGRSGSIQLTDMHLISSKDRAAVKTAIMNHGAVCAVYRSNWDYYSATYNSFYYPKDDGRNHVITLVGWDDDFPAEHFRRGTPPGNGAWLVRNSWGKNEYNYGGYFWLSYYDATLSSAVNVIDVQPWRYDHCYSYDSIPSTWHWKTAGLEAPAQQIYQVDGGEEIRAIGYFSDRNTNSISLTLTYGDKTVTASADIGFRGYRLIPLAEPLLITEKGLVTVECRITGGETPLRYYIEHGKNYSGEYSYDKVNKIPFSVNFSAACDSGGMVVSGRNTNYDGPFKLFTCNTEASPDLAVDQTNFPDSEFRAYVSKEFDRNGDGYLSSSEIEAVTMVDIGEDGEKPGAITSLQGLEHFTRLQHLFCYHNQLKELDVSRNTELISLTCHENQLTALDLSRNTALLYLDCNDNSLTALDIGSMTALDILYCSGNRLTALDISKNTALECLDCSGNQLGALDVAGNGGLIELYCSDNSLTQLDIRRNALLECLYCSGNELVKLNITACPSLLRLISEVQPVTEEGIVTYFNMSDSAGDPFDEDPLEDAFFLELSYDENVVLIFSAEPDFLLPSDLAEIGEEAFAGAAFVSVRLPESVRVIGARAFADCPYLTFVHITGADVTIAEDAFASDTEYTIVRPDGSELNHESN
ncbi:MAG: leucine-rich repeat protein [Oscillospiraceae bacterium]|nr:leucine-rich repeat protein [Oscillospiraceae bacterium]